MPKLAAHATAHAAGIWFDSPAGRCVLDSEGGAIVEVLDERPLLNHLWLSPTHDAPTPTAGQQGQLPARGLALGSVDDGWVGGIRCGLPLPLATESVGTVVLQHVVRSDVHGHELLAECARVLVPGGRLLLFALNPLSPYRWRWRGSGLRACEPITWRRRLRDAGLQAELVSQGVGPSWQPRTAALLQHGPGLRAAYVIRAEKRTVPLTPLRSPSRLRFTQGAPAA